MSTERYSQAFMLIADYATARGWTPIGFREWRIGPWQIVVNGTQDERDGIPPFHARVLHDEYIGIMVLHPFGGTKGGWKDTEDEFIAAMQRELGSLTVERRG